MDRPPVLEGQPSPDPIDLSRELRTGSFARGEMPVTELLYGRLGDDLVAEVKRLSAEDAATRGWRVDEMEPELRHWMVLQVGMWLGIPAVAERSGLPTAQPPDDIHAMARGPLAAAGGLYEADLVVAALASAGIGMEAIASGHDFGCSSGRVVRVLAAAYPGVRWSGSDPNGPAIEWADQNLPGVSFFVNGAVPPLALAPTALDLVFAISVWSHFEPELGLRWFDEMHRVLRPGGHLVITTHGFTSIAHEASDELRAPDQLSEIARDLYRRGWWYRHEFGEEGDWGVVDPGWGTAFLSPEWLLAELLPKWRVLEFAAGRNQGNQDVYVLERV